VFWWFERAGQFLRYESRQSKEGAFELRVMNPDGTERVETFEDGDALAKRQLALEEDLVAQGWNGPHGWNI
jgi:hypothetical protein